MEAIAVFVGYIVMTAGAICGVAGAVIGAAILSNRAQHAAVDSVGGWGTFCDFRDWFHGDRRDGERLKFVIRKDWESACALAGTEETAGTLDEYAEEFRSMIDRAMNVVTPNAKSEGPRGFIAQRPLE